MGNLVKDKKEAAELFCDETDDKIGRGRGMHMEILFFSSTVSSLLERVEVGVNDADP